jgi:MazG nucleotide pyrophosphohydrolase domain.
MEFKEFFDTVKETAQYNNNNAVVYPALGLAGETGEAVDIIKKSIRYAEEGDVFSLIDKKGKDRTEDFKLEMGDVMWYWCNLLIDLDLDPKEIFQMNYDKLRERYK